MAKSFSLPIASESILIAPSVSESRPKFLYVDNKRSESPALSPTGKPLHTFSGVAEIGGKRLGDVQVESTAELPPNLPLGSLLKVTGMAEMRVRPVDQYSLALTIFAEEVVPVRAARGE